MIPLGEDENKYKNIYVINERGGTVVIFLSCPVVDLQSPRMNFNANEQRNKFVKLKHVNEHLSISRTISQVLNISYLHGKAFREREKFSLS